MIFKGFDNCPLHKTELRKGQIKIIYGLQVGRVAQQLNVKGRAAANLFPQANSVGFGSCLAPSSSGFEYQPVKFCPECRKAEYAWEDQHWDARQIRDFSGRYVTLYK